MNNFAIILGHYSLLFGLIAAGWAVLSSSLSAASRRPGLQRSAERSVWAATGFVSLATVCLVWSFLANDFRVDYVFHYSSTSQALQYKIVKSTNVEFFA